MSGIADEDVMLLAMLLILRRRRKRRRQLIRKESPSYKADLESFREFLNSGDNKKRIDGSHLNKSGKRTCKNIPPMKTAEDFMDMTLSSIKLEPAEVDDDWSSHEQNDIHGVSVKDEPIDDWSGVTDS